MLREPRADLNKLLATIGAGLLIAGSLIYQILGGLHGSP